RQAVVVGGAGAADREDLARARLRCPGALILCRVAQPFGVFAARSLSLEGTRVAQDAVKVRLTVEVAGLKFGEGAVLHARRGLHAVQASPVTADGTAYVDHPHGVTEAGDALGE